MDRWHELERLLDAAAALPPDERDAFLDTECPDPDLRAEVESLLAVDAEAGAYFEGLSDVVAPGEAMQAAQVGARLGAWELVAPLGQGGMGTVYRAERADGAFEQAAALKLLDTVRPDVVARFAQERQILARLDHPGIARLLDGGTTPEGRPYLVMELVGGEPITDYAARRRLAVEDRLALFAEVCEAVQAAHQRLVVHRDLKPSNVFVLPDGRVKLLDFGIAKLLADDGTLTLTEQRLLTPAYAAPEQIDGGEVTTATDVYALGVVLYELLTGQRPFEQAVPSALAAAVLGGGAPRPSTATTRRPAEALAAAGLPEARSLKRLLRGDLDAICLKALRARPQDRYRAVEALRDDVLRYLDGRPVEARDGAAAYRTRRFVRRHRVAVAFAALALLALVGGLAVALWQARVAADEADAARLQAQRAEATVDFMTGLFEGVGPDEARGQALAPADLVARGRAQIERLEGQPAVRGELLAVMGRLYHSLGLYGAADSLHAQALALRQATLGPAHPDVAQSLYDRAQALFALRDFGTADSLHRRALAIRRAALPAEDPRHLESLVALASSAANFREDARADSLYTVALARWSGPAWAEHPARLQALVGQAELRAQEGSAGQAEELYRAALTSLSASQGADHPDVADLHYALGEALIDQERYAEASASHTRALALYRRLYTDDHDAVATSLYRLAWVAEERARTDEAQALYREAAAVYARTLGPDHVWAAYPLVSLGRLLHEADRHAEALRTLSDARATYTAAGLEHPDRRLARLDHLMGAVLQALDRPGEARGFLRASRSSYEVLRDEAADSTTLATAQSRLAEIEGALAALQR